MDHRYRCVSIYVEGGKMENEVQNGDDLEEEMLIMLMELKNLKLKG